jgi:murein DD-endopeptidase MepM/ murein hydrolase activator NlpD|tara:strand:+ start:789 stop:1511 length:723 start_codon:yes stop_codon:yes gene_type:complete
MKNLIKKILKEQVTASEFCIPVNGWLETELSKSQKFGACRKKNGVSCGRKHKGNDLTINSGTPLLAASDGKVTIASMTHDPEGYGGFIEIKHKDGIETRYGHCSEIDVKVGDDVVRGEVIGASGGDASDPGNGNSNDAHLHYEVVVNGSRVDPISNGYLSVECGGIETAENKFTPDLIRELQELLLIVGHLHNRDPYTSGLMDEYTIEAIKKLQKKHDLTPSGVFDKETYVLLKQEVDNH